MITRYQKRAFIWSIAGIVLQVLGAMGLLANTKATADLDPAFAAVILLLAGTAILSAGLAFYAAAKERHPAWAAAGLLSFAGLIILRLLEDRNKPVAKKRKKS